MSDTLILIGISLILAHVLMTQSTYPISVLTLACTLLLALSPYPLLPQNIAHIATPDYFPSLLIDLFLPFLLFAGATGLCTTTLRAEWKAIGLMAVGTTALSIGLLALLCRALSSYTTEPWPWLDCMLYASILAPTDPVAVLGLVKSHKIDQRTTTLISGEALFNDAIAITFYAIIMTYKASLQSSCLSSLLIAVYELTFGIGAAYLVFFIRKQLIHLSKRHISLDVLCLLDIGCVLLSYHLGLKYHYSGALSVIVLGILIADHQKEAPTSYLHVWETFELTLNVLLYGLMGLLAQHMALTPLIREYVLILFYALPVIRMISIVLPLAWTPFKYHLKQLLFLTNSGLKGGLTLALACALPSTEYAPDMVAVVYWIVCLSVLIQGSLSLLLPGIQQRSR